MDKNLEVVDLDAEYFLWLCNDIRLDTMSKSYRHLVRVLHDHEYYWSIARDDNRCTDAERLRDNFTEAMDYEDDILYHIIGPCRVLEMLVALARRFDYMILDSTPEFEMFPNQLRPCRWFWEMLDNLGLLEFSDEYFEGVDEGKTLDRIDDILTNLLERTYEHNGEGSLFPLENPKRDMRKVEIWYQMSEYVLENYYKNYV
ncbi:MAG TPA: hypothetical protein VFC70_03280 [Oscillospiraceae bacterium]|nr:hypothetical protein [Oscillospiraceae bacterium]